MGSDIMRYRCEAHGVAVGSENGSHLLVSVRKISPKVHADRVVFLERGQHGIVPFLQNTPFAYKPEDLDCVFWYFGSRDREHAIGSYSHDTISPQNGICLGCNNISSNLALVIQNVTDSDEGTYFYTVVPHVGRLHEGTVEVAVKVSAKKPFPVVPGCVPQQSELSDECIISVPHDMVNVTLTCKVEQVKPPVAIRWSIVFQDGRVEEAESTYTRYLTEAHQPGSSSDNTYTTASSLYLSKTVNDSVKYRCKAYGVAAGGENGRQVTVTVRRDLAPVWADTTRTTSPDLVKNFYIVMAISVVMFVLLLLSLIVLFWVIKSRNHRKTIKGVMATQDHQLESTC
ncbi:CD226 antigen-like [Acanthaster planci]|uniref:CD226 antigen-like n=1 Tax=Acanthaster planci TaxID=133434 RepID=A0A8B7YKL9_ACAPL|nr:CD226 antigen-like [Acanthaster planci]